MYDVRGCYYEYTWDKVGNSPRGFFFMLTSGQSRTETPGGGREKRRLMTTLKMAKRCQHSNFNRRSKPKIGKY